MKKNKEKKKKIIKKIKKIIKKNNNIIISKYNLIKNNKITILRKEAKKLNIFIRVFKNNLFIKSIINTKFEIIKNKIKNQLIYSISNNLLNNIKLLSNFYINNKNFKLKYCIYKNKIIEKKDILSLSKINNKKEILIKLLWIISKYPILNFLKIINYLIIKKKNEY
ncbi:putative 50S ribosomal subunit protein L10 [Candidatus Zinderia insecticola CARI]|uniref:Large ribosomal subunit protein uL10 n=1 Tax=Zinderia insecticola (strain CARI) TaxID=871271 RepID=E0TIP4_ZINIC|nr:putative 50S ribosomal subunit protein L10 [Candidatus Zinderia insecticola CARI]